MTAQTTAVTVIVRAVAQGLAAQMTAGVRGRTATATAAPVTTDVTATAPASAITTAFAAAIVQTRCAQDESQPRRGREPGCIWIRAHALAANAAACATLLPGLRTTYQSYQRQLSLFVCIGLYLTASIHAASSALYSIQFEKHGTKSF